MHASANRDQRYGARHPVGLCLTLNQPKGTGQQFRFIYDLAVMVEVAELVQSLVRERKERGCEGWGPITTVALGVAPIPMSAAIKF